MKTKNWFEVDKEGLAKILSRRGKEFVIYELLQNSWDEDGVTEVKVTAEYRGYNKVFLNVEDDCPNGFQNLKDAYILFKESKKKNDPTKRGRFNLGEKLVLALCETAIIQTTIGTIEFKESGRSSIRSKNKREKGSRFSAVLKMTKEEFDQLESAVHRLIPPNGIITLYNGNVINHKEIIYSGLITLPTEISNGEGFLVRSNRSTMVQLLPSLGNAGWIYEMGIPVVETGDKFHYNVMQKVPINLDRDNVPPILVKRLRTFALNHSYLQLTQTDFQSEWAGQAVEAEDVYPEAARAFADARFGAKRVTYDPSDTEANKRAVAAGYTVIHPRQLNKDQWEQIRRLELAPAAGKVTPSDKVWTGEDNLNATPFCDWIPEDKWTAGMRKLAEFAKQAAQVAFHHEIEVRFCSTSHHLGAASYGSRKLTFNKFRLGNEFFEEGINVRQVSLVIHELAHEFSMDHLSESYYDALSDIGAKLCLSKSIRLSM